MGKEKGGFMSPKAIANRIKSKGLQKLRWYCQMCQKQCRDENGFKCHLTSESHQRQLLLFAEDPDQYIDSFSEEFCSGYLELLRRRFGTKRVQANIVYQEYINDKEHVHMNSTQWETLTDFVQWLGREGKCVVDHTEKGWYITYIDRDPATIRRMEAQAKKERMEMDDDEKTAKMIEKQIEKAKTEGKDYPVHEATELKRENEEEKIVLSMSMSAKKKPEPSTSKGDNPFEHVESDKESAQSGGKDKASEGETSSGAPKRKASALGDIIKMEESKKEKINRKDYWLHEGIVVKIVTKKLGQDFYKKKAVVREVTDKYAAVVKVIDSGDKLKVDQVHVETVIPANGRAVLIVNGAYRGMEAMLDSLDVKRFSCAVTITKGLMKGRVVSDIPYEDVSKLHQ